MSGMYVVFGIVAASTLVSLCYLLISIVKKSPEMRYAGLTMLFSPPMGVICFFGGYVYRKVIHSAKNRKKVGVEFDIEHRNRLLMPNVEAETQVAPLEEVLLVSATSEKRKLLLAELKKDYIKNYSAIAKAFDNEDHETSHYAAAAVTNAKSGFENDIREFDTKYHRNKDDLENVRSYSDYVLSFLRCGILDKMEMKKYSYLYINLITGIKNPNGFMTEQDYTNMVGELIYVGDYQAALNWAEIPLKVIETESAYLNMLRVYYHTGRAEQFFETLERLKKSDVALSHEGLDLVRFFIKSKGIGA